MSASESDQETNLKDIYARYSSTKGPGTATAKVDKRKTSDLRFANLAKARAAKAARQKALKEQAASGADYELSSSDSDYESSEDIDEDELYANKRRALTPKKQNKKVRLPADGEGAAKEIRELKLMMKKLMLRDVQKKRKPTRKTMVVQVGGAQPTQPIAIPQVNPKVAAQKLNILGF
jgi:hypothetical protein